MNFLIVDDDFISRTKMVTILETFGGCTAVENGREALEVFNNSLKVNLPFGLITLDISMPDMNGDEVLQEIREIETANNTNKENQVKIIMVTSHADKDTIITCLQAGCTDYIVKPFNMETLEKKIDEMGLNEKPEILQPTEIKNFNSLVIDDDFVSRTKMHTILETFGKAEAIDNGKDAIELFIKSIENNTPYDLITLDIEMPDMDGTEVLINIREIEVEKNILEQQKVSILMVTSHTDKDTFITCRQAGCNDYIVKPFDEKSISNKLKEIKSKSHFNFSDKNTSEMNHTVPTISSIIEDVSIALKNDAIELPSFPDISLKFKKLLDKGADIDEIEALLKTDIGISSKLIRVSNTAFYRGVAKNETLAKAISRLGLEATKQVVEAICNRDMYSKTSKEYSVFVDKLWKHSISCAFASQFICETLNIKLKHDPFTLGLFHDIGKLILLQIIDELEKREKFGKELEKKTLFGTLDKFHGEFGASLLKKWGFHNSYCDIAMHHGNIENVNPLSDELKVVHFANLLVKTIDSTESSSNIAVIATSKSAVGLGLNPVLIGTIADKVVESVITDF